MPEAPTIVPPTPAARPAAAGAPSAVPASAGEIHVTPRGSVPTPAATPPAKPESAKGKMFKALQDKADKGAAARPGTAAAPVTEPPAKPSPAAPAAEPKPGESAPPADPKPGEGAPASTAVDKDGKKPSPWKMVEEYKGKLAKAEARVKELETNHLPENDRKAYEERATRAEARAKQLEEVMADHDFSQTDTFQKEFVKPYDEAWKVAMTELKGVQVSDGQGGAREINPNDMLTLVNMELAQARHVANEYFGDFANDVMNHRNAIRDLYNKQQAKLKAEKEGRTAKKQQETEAQTKAREELTRTISTTWQQENEAVLKDEKYGALFKPRDGDEHWNQRLAKGFELVDKAFSQNPADPSLSPEERASVIRRHAAVRNRAAAWGPLRGEVERLTAENKTLSDELAQYKQTEPPGGAGRTQAQVPGTPGPGGAKAQLWDALKKKAR